MAVEAEGRTPKARTVRQVEIAPTFESWQQTARALLRERVPPAEVVWREVAAPPSPPEIERAAQPVTRVPRQFVELAGQAAGHSDPARWALLYEVLWPPW